MMEEIEIKAILKRKIMFDASDWPEKDQHRLVSICGKCISNIINPSLKVQKIAVRHDPWSIRLIKEPSETIQIQAVKINGDVIHFIKNPSEIVQLVAVSSKGGYGLALEEILSKKIWPSTKVILAAISNSRKRGENHLKNTLSLIKNPSIVLNSKHPIALNKSLFLSYSLLKEVIK